MQGITSYKHLNEVIIMILKEDGGEMYAHEINDLILKRYRVGKVRINPLKIAKRLVGIPEVEVSYGGKGLFVYRYNRHI